MPELNWIRIEPVEHEPEMHITAEWVAEANDHRAVIQSYGVEEVYTAQVQLPDGTHEIAPQSYEDLEAARAWCHTIIFPPAVDRNASPLS